MIWKAAKRAKVPPSITVSLTDKAKKMKNAGIDVISLAAGEPDFVTPAHIRQYAKEALDAGYTSYGSSSGLSELRRAIAEKLEVENGFAIDPDSEIIITVGGKQAIFTAILALVNPRDEVLIFDPAWVTYEPCVLFAEGKPVWVPPQEGSYSIDEETIESYITPKTKMVILNSPNNPTGNVCEKKDLEVLADVARRHNLLVLSDEIYEKIIFDQCIHYSIASFPGMKDRTITVNSFSKTYAMAGWRLGYMVADKEIIRHVMPVHQHSVTGPCNFAQRAAALALKDERTQNAVREMAAEYEKRRNVMVEGLNKINGFSCSKPKGTFYAFPSTTNLEKNSGKLAEYLLEQTRVATVPGVAFGKQGEGHLRLSFANSMENIKEALTRIDEALQNYPKS